MMPRRPSQPCTFGRAHLRQMLRHVFFFFKRKLHFLLGGVKTDTRQTFLFGHFLLVMAVLLPTRQLDLPECELQAGSAAFNATGNPLIEAVDTWLKLIESKGSVHPKQANSFYYLPSNHDSEVNWD